MKSLIKNIIFSFLLLTQSADFVANAQTSFALTKDDGHYFTETAINGLPNIRIMVETGVPAVVIDEENFEGAPISYSRQLTYLKLPLLTHIYFGSRRFKCFVNLGPEFSMMIGEKIRSDFDYRNPFDNPDFPSRNRQVEQMWTDIHNKFDYGITAGIGFEFYVQPRHSITLECRYYYGLGNIFPASKADTFGASRPTDIEATIGYNFRIK